MVASGQARDHAVMAYFLVEIHMSGAGQLELDRALELLEVAQSRLREGDTQMSAITAGFSRVDGRLVCLIKATNLESARLLVSVALLPSGRIREITHLTQRRLLGSRDPGGDVDARVETELVEDVVDVGLDRPLGQE